MKKMISLVSVSNTGVMIVISGRCLGRVLDPRRGGGEGLTIRPPVGS